MFDHLGSVYGEHPPDSLDEVIRTVLDIAIAYFGYVPRDVLAAIIFDFITPNFSRLGLGAQTSLLLLQ